MQKPIPAAGVPAKRGESAYPQPYAAQVAGRTKRKLGNCFGLTNFGVNQTELEPGSVSALLHYHDRQDEFIYILEGTPTVVIGKEEFQLAPGDCVGFKAGTGIPHQLVNRSQGKVVYLEIGDRTPGDTGGYPDDDLAWVWTEDGRLTFTRRDGTPY